MTQLIRTNQISSEKKNLFQSLVFGIFGGPNVPNDIKYLNFIIENKQEIK